MNSRRLLVIGTGLIGASIAKSAKLNSYCDTVIGHSKTKESLEYCLRHAIIDDAIETLDDCSQLTGNDIIAICTPVLAFEKVLKSVLKACLHAQDDNPENKPTIIDTLSVKQFVVEHINQQGRPDNMIPCHPIAGAERSGPSVSTGNLFDGKQIIITPTEYSDPYHIKQAHLFWNALGGKIIEMSAVQHDAIFAATSHLPHVVAYALMNALNEMDDGYNVFDYAASGFKDFSRIAASDPTMWHDVCLTNSLPIIEQIDSIQKQLNIFKQAITEKNSTVIYNKIELSQQLRQKLD